MGQRGVLHISSDRDDHRILGLKFSILGFLFGRKIWASIFWASLIYQIRDFFGYSKQSEDL